MPKKLLENVIGGEVNVMSYPFGLTEDCFSAEHLLKMDEIPKKIKDKLSFLMNAPLEYKEGVLSGIIRRNDVSDRTGDEVASILLSSVCKHIAKTDSDPKKVKLIKTNWHSISRAYF